MPDTQWPEFESLDEILGIAGPLLEIMDILAMEEGADRYLVLVGQGMARVTGFEPNEEQLSRLKARPGPYTYHSAFLGDGKLTNDICDKARILCALSQCASMAAMLV